MKKRIAKLLLISLTTLVLLSCRNNNNENKNNSNTEINTKSTIDENTNTNINSSSIFNLNNNNNNQVNNITNLTLEEQNKFLSMNIDPYKVSETMKLAENGDENSIMSLVQLYYEIKDREKLKYYLTLGADNNIEDAIYNLMILNREDGNEKEAERLYNKLSDDYKEKILPPGALDYNKALEYMDKKDYANARRYFIRAYNKGMKEVDIQVALLYKQAKNVDKALLWFKRADSRKVEGVAYEIGALLFDSGKYNEAYKYLVRAYNDGAKDLAYPIAITFYEKQDLENALKWFKRAKEAGVPDAANAVEQLEYEINASKNTQETNVSNTIFKREVGNDNSTLVEKNNKLLQQELHRTTSNIPTQKLKEERSDDIENNITKPTYNVPIN